MPPDAIAAAGKPIGRPPMSPDDPLCTTSVMIPASVKIGLVAISERTGRSYSDVIRDALTDLVIRASARAPRRRP